MKFQIEASKVTHISMSMQAEDILKAMRNNSIEATIKSYKQMILAYTKSDDVLHIQTTL